jgi:hypothetical protein
VSELDFYRTHSRRKVALHPLFARLRTDPAIDSSAALTQQASLSFRGNHETVMDKGRRDLAHHLFAATPVRIEDTAGIAVAAQGAGVPSAHLGQYAAQLQQSAQTVGALTAGAGIIAAPPKKSRSS